MTRSLNENPQFRDAPQVYLTHRGAAWRSRGERANGIHGNIGVLLAEEAAVWSCVWRAKMMQAQAQQQQMPQAAGAGTSLQSLMLMRLLVPVCIHGNFLERYTNLGCSCTNPAVPTSSVMDLSFSSTSQQYQDSPDVYPACCDAQHVLLACGLGSGGCHGAVRDWAPTGAPGAASTRQIVG